VKIIRNVLYCVVFHGGRQENLKPDHLASLQNIFQKYLEDCSNGNSVVQVS